MTNDEISRNIALLPESLIQENTQSWQHITKLFELYARNPRYRPFLDLVKTLSGSMQSKLFRAGASALLLMISTKEKNGLDYGDPYVYVEVRDENTAEVGYCWDTTESKHFICKDDEILPVILPLLDTLWNETRGKQMLEKKANKD